MTTDQRPVFDDIGALRAALQTVAEIQNHKLQIRDADGFRGEFLDRLIVSAVFGTADVQEAARWIIRAAGPRLGAFPASIHDLYAAAGQGAYANVTAPAINVRGLTYDIARAIFRAAQANDSKIVLFEIARSEMGYTNQRPAEYASSILAAAIKENHQGPVFIQGDHFQANAKKYTKDPAGEIQAVRDLAAEALAAGFYNIDIDASTLVDLSVPDLKAQQERNYMHSAELTAFIRQQEPEGITTSVGGEIGEVGGRNSTVDDLHAFMSGYEAELERYGTAAGRKFAGISKISVQTGTSHGGVPLPDGTIAQVKVDFDTLAALSKAAREEYGMGGAVQHGASTLPEIAFDRFAQANAIEVHLATAFQNQIYDHPAFPSDLKQRIYAHLAEHHADERKPNQTDAQFYYTTRKRGFGPFKRELWGLPSAIRDEIVGDLEETFRLVMRRLGVTGSAALVDRHVSLVEVDIAPPASLEQ